MSQLLDSLSSGLQAEVDLAVQDVEHEEPDVFMAHKHPLEMYIFLIHWFVIAAEKVHAKAEEEAPSKPAVSKDCALMRAGCL